MRHKTFLAPADAIAIPPCAIACTPPPRPPVGCVPGEGIVGVGVGVLVVFSPGMTLFYSVKVNVIIAVVT